MLATGCGYRAVYAQPDRAQLSVQLGQIFIPEPAAAQSVASGARSELAASGLLASGSAGTRLVIDVLRVDELSRGIGAIGRLVPGSDPDRPRYFATGPTAAGMSIAVTVRGRVFPANAQEPTLDTGDLRRAVQLTGDADPRADGAAYDQALRAAAERAGKAAARSAMGLPEPADETP